MIIAAPIAIVVRRHPSIRLFSFREPEPKQRCGEWIQPQRALARPARGTSVSRYAKVTNATTPCLAQAQYPPVEV
jgi:hypothetical protein